MARILRLMFLPFFAILTLVLPLSAVAAPAGDPVAKTDVCHYDAKKDAYKLLPVIDAALPGHFSHGDALPGAPAPLDPGFVLDETCTLVPVVVTEAVIDQNQPVYQTLLMACTYQDDLAQSFQTQSPYPTSGAGAYLTYFNTVLPTPLTISLWDALPNAGGTMLAEGSAPAVEGWVDVTWQPVTLEVGTTYYLVLGSGGSYEDYYCYAGTDYDSYPYGYIFANAGFANQFTDYDFTFRTWVDAPIP